MALMISGRSRNKREDIKTGNYTFPQHCSASCVFSGFCVARRTQSRKTKKLYVYQSMVIIRRRRRLASDVSKRDSTCDLLITAFVRPERAAKKARRKPVQVKWLSRLHHAPGCPPTHSHHCTTSREKKREHKSEEQVSLLDVELKSFFF